MKKSIFLSILLAQLAFSYTNISNNELEQLSAEDAIIIDVRREDEWIETGVIKNSKLITYFDNYNRPMLKPFLDGAKRATNGDKLKPIVVLCRSGSRSIIASEALDKAGYRQVYNLKYGILGWISDRKYIVKYAK